MICILKRLITDNNYRKNQEKITAVVRDFYYKMGMNYEKELLNIMMIIRPVFSKRNYIVKKPSGRIELRSANCNNKEPGGLFYERKRYRKFAAHNMEMPISCGIRTKISANGNIWSDQERYRTNTEKAV